MCVVKPMKEEANEEARGEEGERKRRTDVHASDLLRRAHVDGAHFPIGFCLGGLAVPM